VLIKNNSRNGKKINNPDSFNFFDANPKLIYATINRNKIKDKTNIQYDKVLNKNIDKIQKNNCEM
jgi:hypothetical protein